MKSFYLTTSISLLLLVTLTAQSDWQEHFSHDRYSYTHFGHFIINDEVVLLMGNEKLPMNTLEIIKGNTKKESEVISEYFSFRNKTTRTGIDSKEILLKDAWDYDIPGYGAHSIYEKNDEFHNRSIPQIEDDYISIKDARISGEATDPKEFITYNTRYYLNHLDEVLDSEDLEGTLAYHEGLGGAHFQVLNGIFSSENDTPSGELDLGEYNFLENDPYLNQIIEVEANVLNLYSYDDFTQMGSVTLPESFLNLQVTEDGYFTLNETDNEYLVYFTSKSTLNSEIHYTLPKVDEVENFDINDFEVVEDDIYFFGIVKSPFNQLVHSYVQKRTIDKPFEPVRKDLELTFASVEGEDSWGEGWFDYTFKCTVTNVSNKPVNHFTVYTSTLPVSFSKFLFGKNDTSVELLPGESIEVEGEFSFYEVSSIKLHIVGVDFGFDSDESNNSFTADVKTSVNEVKKEKLFTISPNPTSNFINLKGDFQSVNEISIIDVRGNQLELNTINSQTIDISFLPPGNYSLMITTKDRTERHHFVKI